MKLIEKMKISKELLVKLIKKMGKEGHNEILLQQLMKCYLDIYLADNYQKLGDCIDAFQNCTSINLDSDFFGQIIKTEEYTSAEDDSLGSSFTNDFRSSFVHTIIKHSETLKQIYTNLGVLDADQKEAQFWWNNVTNALTEFEFEDLCKVIPNKNVSDVSYFILEKDLRVLLMEKGILEDNYTINYGRLFGGRVLFVGDALDELDMKEFDKQRQKGLYTSRNPKNAVGISQQ